MIEMVQPALDPPALFHDLTLDAALFVAASDDSPRDRFDVSLIVGFVHASDDTHTNVLRIVRYVCFHVLTHMLCNRPLAATSLERPRHRSRSPRSTKVSP